MALDPELVDQYAHAKQQYDRIRTSGLSPNSPEVLEVQENYRATLAAYLLDLQTNGMSVPEELAHDLDTLDDAAD